MSLFDYPRINIQGTLQLNPGTANNDDYAGAVKFPPDSPNAGATLALIDSKLVRARTYGMSDADFIAWAQQPHTFVNVRPPPPTEQIIPAEWNYYGDMSYHVATASIIGVQTGPGQLYTSVDPSVSITALLGASFTFSGGICDVNSEGSPPATQFFISNLNVASGQTTYLDGQPQKGACQWLNFYRNVNLTADGGAGGYVYHVMLKGDGNTIDIPGFEDPRIKGLILRYYIYATQPGKTDNADIVALYQGKTTNPAIGSFIATIAPLYEDEHNLCGPAGRLLVANTPNVPGPPGAHNNGPNNVVALAPAVLHPRPLPGGKLNLCADFSGTFPEYFQNGQNPKYNFDPVTLVIEIGEPGQTTSINIATVDYTNGYGDPRGWVYEFEVQNAFARAALSSGVGTLRLVSTKYGTVLDEVEYYFVSNQQGIYAEQNGPGDQFRNQGTIAPATVSVYQRGKLLAPGQCPPITVWQYCSIPLQAPGEAVAIDKSFQPGKPLRVDTSQPGNFLFTFTIGEGNAPPASYSTFMFPPYITNSPSMSLRILPNDEDFSQYYVDPSAAEPAGNDKLTFDVVYAKVLQTYYLLYPAMNKFFALNSEQAVNAAAGAILARTEYALWMTTGYMPRTRDLSQSRRALLRAYCRKVLLSPTRAAV